MLHRTSSNVRGKVEFDLDQRFVMEGECLERTER